MSGVTSVTFDHFTSYLDIIFNSAIVILIWVGGGYGSSVTLLGSFPESHYPGDKKVIIMLS